MNIYFFIILITLIGIFVVDSISQLINIKSLSLDLPEEFTGIYNSDEYKRSIEYIKTRELFELIESSSDIAVLLVFWLSGGFNWVDIWIRKANYHPIVNGLLFFGILMITKHIIFMPFNIYSTFVIEEKYGFNKTTVKTFIFDQIKMLLLISFLGGSILSGLLGFFQLAGSFAWLYGFLTATIFIIFLQFVAPTWIMPIFNKFTPLKEGELKTAIMNYSHSVEFPLQGLFVIDGSKRSTKSNAFFTGFGKNKRIALFDTLIEKHSVLELVSILAHEIGHYKKKHIIKNMIISIIEMGVFFYLLSFFISKKEIFDAFYFKNMSIYAGFMVFILLYSPISFILSLLMQILSRKHEYEADNFAVETTKDPESLIKSLKKLAISNMSNLTPHPFYVFLHYSHPPILLRIKNIREYSNRSIFPYHL
ncbi:MAG: M48 family metallopeptidase [Candidatus Firestonebacteria bacterium]|nr:M48 family metallopeptidase [Candidatus Firestonebacteria bacterium]